MSRYVRHRPPAPAVHQRWQAFLRNYRDSLAGLDFFTSSTARFQCLWVFLIIPHAGRCSTLPSPIIPEQHGSSSNSGRRSRSHGPSLPDSEPRLKVWLRSSGRAGKRGHRTGAESATGTVAERGGGALALPCNFGQKGECPRLCCSYWFCSLGCRFWFSVFPERGLAGVAGKSA